MAPKDDPGCYFAASAIAAVINFPLWKASAIAQAGFKQQGNGALGQYLEALKPPYKGVLAVMVGMTWARGAIFYGSDTGKAAMIAAGWDTATSTVVPPLLVSTFVQVVNQPIVRGSITVQDPASPYRSTSEALRVIAATKGVSKLWHGISAGVMKTVPKYCTAIAAKDAVEAWLPKSDHPTHSTELGRSAVKSVVAGVAGAALTNPLDVLRNEMFKTDLGVGATLRKLIRDEGKAWPSRGMGKNLVAVSIPIAITIFATDALVNMKKGRADADAAPRR